MLVLYTQDFQGIYLQKKLEKLLIKVYNSKVVLSY